VHTSPVFLAANSDSLTEGSIVRSLRTHATDIFDIHMIVLDKMRPRRSRHGHAPAGGYKIRRKDWAEVTRRFPTFSPEYWDIRTIYIVRSLLSPSSHLLHFDCALLSSKENIPLEFRSIIGTSKLLHRLLKNNRTPSFSLSDYRCVQSILFPPHHQDPPDAVPKCRGFALVTFSTPSDASRLLADFPYHYRENNHSADSDDDDPSAEEREARKAGFRTLSKERWESLQAEYVEYRDALLGRIAASSSPAPASCSTEPDVPIRTAPADNVTDVSGKARLQHASEAPMKFPPGCVVFARHVPENTNKTALRALFSALLDDSSTSALDYVDYTKGLDTVRLPLCPCRRLIMSLFEQCHLRLTTREHALSLLKRFKLKCGKGDGEEDKIMLESLDGRREEMYWEGVPDKVRALAVQRAQQAQKAQRANGDLVQKDDQDVVSGELKPPRKRQRR
jgi:hypothetical protein